MKKTPGTTTNSNSDEKNAVLITSGELFPDGTAIELVATGSPNDEKLGLSFWNGKKLIIAPEIERERLIFRPPDLHASILRAIRLPRRATSYGRVKALFTSVRDLFENYVGLGSREASLLTLWVVTTWFADCLPSPPQLSISGPDTRLGVKLLTLLKCLCRHPLLMTDLTRQAFCTLVYLVRPTMLVCQPGLSNRILSLWYATAFRGVFVPGKNGSVADITCAKAFFHGMDGAPCPWSDDALHLALPPAQADLPPLDESRQVEIADRFQSELAMYRLRNFRRVSEHAAEPSGSPSSTIARYLTACVEAEDDIVTAVTPLLQSQEQDAEARRGCDVNRIIVEVIWASSHEGRDVSVSDIRKLANALLRKRGEILEFSSEEIGRKMRDLGLYRHRNAGGMVLKFSRDNRARIHELARSLGLDLRKVNTCPYCCPEVIVT